MSEASSRRPGRRAARRKRAALGLAGVSVLAAACGSGHRAAAPTTTEPTTTITTVAPTTTTTLPPPTYPLTGMPAAGAAQMHSPAVVVKIDNIGAARPQTGVDSADVVYDAEVEGGLSRLAAVFQSKYPTSLGPVRSGRLTDAGVADDLGHPVLAFSGTNDNFMRILQTQPVDMVTMDNHPEMFARVGGNVPHNVYTSVARLSFASSVHTGPPALFQFLRPGQPFAGAGVAPAAAVSFSFPAASVSWAWDAAAARWERTQDGTPDVVASGRRLSATNVVIYFVSYITSGMATGEGVPPTPIPEGILTGSGNAWIFSAGKVVKGTWSRPSMTTPAAYKDSSGAPIALSPGSTWVELAPVGTIPAITP